MTFLRNLSHDLIDKKLWPLAVVLLAALVAVPMVLGGGGDVDQASTPAPAPVPGATASSTPGAAEVAVAVEEPALRRRDGAIRDPFKQQYVQKAVEATTGGAGPATSTPSTGPSTSSGGATPPQTGTGGGPGTTPAAPDAKPAPPKFDPFDVYRVSLRFGEPGGLKTKRDIPRLSPLPNAERPFFVFLGVLSGGKKAVFLVSSDAEATGDGTCRPSPTNCETVEMERGDTEFFDLETEDGVVQYQLDLVSIRKRSDTPLAVAVAADKGAKKPTTSSENRAVKDDAAADEEELGTDAYRWDEERGVLVRRKKASASMNVGGGLLRALRTASEDLVAADEAAWRSATP